MGMFDRVMVTCPKCGEEIEFQSKAHECALAEYTLYNMPSSIAADLEGANTTCPGCKANVSLQMHFIVNTDVIIAE